MRESIRGYTDAVLEDAVAAGTAEAVAAGVAAVRDLVARAEDLRDVIADPGVPVHARRGVLQELVDGRIDPLAVRLVLHVIDADRAPDVADDYVWMANRAAAVAGHLLEVGVTTVGRRAAALERSEGYATALLEGVHGEAALSDLEDELFRFERAIDASPQLAEAVTSWDLPVEVRSGVVHDLLAGKASNESRRLAVYLTRIGRPRDYVEMLNAVVARIGAETDRRVAVVRAPVALTDEQEARLSAALSRIVGQQIEIRVTVDRRVLGGFVATIGDTVIDASARHRLDLLRERLALPDISPLT